MLSELALTLDWMDDTQKEKVWGTVKVLKME